MAYEVIDENLKVEVCEVGDLTLSQIESFLRLCGDGEKIETLTLSIGLCQIFSYGVIEGKRAERARRAQHHD